MDSDLNKRYCKNKIRKLRKNTKKHYGRADIEEKDARQFKLDRFVKDIQTFKRSKQSEKKRLQNFANNADQENSHKVKNTFQKIQQQNYTNNANKEMHKEKAKRKRGLFDYGHMTTSITRGLLGGPHSARYDQDLLKIIGLSNVKHLSTNTKLETDISNIHNEIIEPETAPTSPNETEHRVCSSVPTTLKVEENKKKSPNPEKESYPEFIRVINQSLALEKYSSFKNENYAKEIKIGLRNIYLKRLKKPQCERPLSTERSSTNITFDFNSPSFPVMSTLYNNKECINNKSVQDLQSQELQRENTQYLNLSENDLLHNNVVIVPQYKSTREFLKETLGVGSSSPVQRSSDFLLSPYEKPKLDQHVSRFCHTNTVRDGYHPLHNHCFTNHIKHPVSKLPYPQEYLLTSTHHHKTSPVLCLPHPAAKYLNNHSERPSGSQPHVYGRQRNLEEIDGSGDRLQISFQSLFPLPPKDPSPEFQHYPFQMF